MVAAVPAASNTTTPVTITVFAFAQGHEVQGSFHERQGRTARRHAFGNCDGRHGLGQRHRRDLNGMGGNRIGNDCRRRTHAALGKITVQLFQRVNDPFLRRVLTDAGDRGHLGKTFAAKKPQHHRRAILVAQLTHRILQQRRELLPGFIERNGMGRGLHIGLLFTADAAGFTPQEARRRQPRGLIQPAGQDGFVHDAPGLFRQNDEHRLRDFLGGMGIAGFSQRSGKNQVHVACN